MNKILIVLTAFAVSTIALAQPSPTATVAARAATVQTENWFASHIPLEAGIVLALALILYFVLRNKGPSLDERILNKSAKAPVTAAKPKREEAID